MKIPESIIILSLVALPLMAAADIVPQQNKDGKWGFADASGKQIIKAEYTDVNTDSQGYYLVAKGGSRKDGILSGEKWGVIDKEGNILLKPEYDEIGDIVNGAAYIDKGGKYGFVDKNYKLIVQPKYNFVGEYNTQGIVWVCNGGKPDKNNPNNISNGKFGVIDLAGNIILKPEHKTIGVYPNPQKIEKAAQLNDWDAEYDEKNSKRKEKTAYPDHIAQSNRDRLFAECGTHVCVWAEQFEPHQGNKLPETAAIAFCGSPKLNKYGVVDIRGNIIAKKNVYNRIAAPSENYCVIINKIGKMSYLDLSTGKVNETMSLKGAFSFNRGVAIAFDSKNKWRFVNKDLTLSNEAYDWISPRLGGIYLVRHGKTMSVLDADTRKPIVSDKAMILMPSHGVMAYQDAEGGKWGYLNLDGSVALAPMYDRVSTFNSDGISVISEGTLFGIIDRSFNKLLPASYKRILTPQSADFQSIWISPGNDKDWTYIDRNTLKPVFGQKYLHAYNFNNGVALVCNNEKKWGYINADGTVHIPHIADTEDIAQEAISYKSQHLLTQWRDIDTYRFNVLHSSERFTLSQPIPDKCWDY